MAKKLLILILVNEFLFNVTYLYSAEPLSLGVLIEEAKKNNPEILAAGKRYEAAKARIPQAKSLDDPVIGLTFEKAKGSPFQLQTTESMDRMLSLSQMLPWFGKLPLKGKIAFVESQMLAAELKDKELSVINSVKQAYYGLFMNYKEIELRKTSLRLLEDTAKIAEDRYVIGEITQEAIFKLDLEIAKLDNDIINLEHQKLAKETRLNSLLNKDPEGPFDKPGLEEDAIVFNKDIRALYLSALENQPELRTFYYAIERNRYAKSLAKKSFFPDLMAGVVMRGFSTGTIGPWDLMLAFTLPLWFWTKQRYQVKEAIANLEEAEAAYRAMQNAAFSQIKDLAVNIGVAKNKIDLYKHTQIPLLESSINSSLSAYRSGNGDIMMLLDSQRMLIEANMDYYKALVEYHMNVAELERTVGAGLKEVKK